MSTEAQVLELHGKVNALIDILSNRQSDSLDGLKIQSFIDNYAFIDAIVENDSITSMIENIVIIKSRFESVESRIEGILGAAELESEKLADSLGDGASSLALSSANNALFQSSVYDANKNMLQHLADLDVSGKIQKMDSALSQALGLISNLRDQKSQIDVLFEKIEDNRELIDGQQDTNDQQELLIADSQTLVVELEKQIENYAFFAEEFDKIYVVARDFIEVFDGMLTTMNQIKERDAKVELLLVSATAIYTEEIALMDTQINDIKYTIDNFASMTSQKINDMAMFINEFKAISIELDSFNSRNATVRSGVTTAMANIDNSDMMFD